MERRSSLEIAYNVNNKRSMENTELKHILISYKSTNIGLQQAHDEILRLFNVVGQSEQCDHDYSDGTGTGWNVCKKCGDMY